MRTSTIMWAGLAALGVGVFLAMRPQMVATAGQQKGDSGQSALGTVGAKRLQGRVLGWWGGGAPNALAINDALLDACDGGDQNACAQLDAAEAREAACTDGDRSACEPVPPELSKLMRGLFP